MFFKLNCAAARAVTADIRMEIIQGGDGRSADPCSANDEVAAFFDKQHQATEKIAVWITFGFQSDLHAVNGKNRTEIAVRSKFKMSPLIVNLCSGQNCGPLIEDSPQNDRLADATFSLQGDGSFL